MRSVSSIFLGALTCLFLTGCFSREVSLHVDPDGSGKLVVATTVSDALLEYMRGIAGQSSDEVWFKEKSLRESAMGYGQGVKYASHEVVDVEQGKIYRVTYEVEDISKVKLNVDVNLPFLLTPPDRARNSSYPPFTFEQTGRGAFVISAPPVSPAAITSPKVKVESAKAWKQRAERFQSDLNIFMRYGNPFGLSGKESSEELLRKLTASMSFSLRVVPEGVVTVSNARHQTDEGIVLFSMRVSEALKDETFMRRAREGTLHEVNWSELMRNPATRGETGERVLLHLREPDGE